jgi:hypothetical protein
MISSRNLLIEDFLAIEEVRDCLGAEVVEDLASNGGTPIEEKRNCCFNVGFCGATFANWPTTA